MLNYMDTGLQKRGREVIMLTYSRTTVYFKKCFREIYFGRTSDKILLLQSPFSFSENLTDPHNCAVNTRMLKIKSD